MRNKNEYKFIIEETNIVSYDDIKILEEGTVNKKPKVAFEANLQSANEKNNNKRYYSTQICETIVNRLSPKASNRSLLMEIDHPMFVSSDTNTLKKRAGIVEINNAAAVVRKIGLKDGIIIGEIETLSGFKGPDLANLISKDKVNIGFSLRALGSVEETSDGTLMVKEPIMPITYDIVSNPSHQSARVMDFLPETSTDFIPDQGEVLYESGNIYLLESDRVTVNTENCVITFINEVIDDRFLDIITKKIEFKI
ncbi:MAG: S80 family phage morphogenetic serine protease [bacterium]